MSSDDFTLADLSPKWRPPRRFASESDFVNRARRAATARKEAGWWRGPLVVRFLALSTDAALLSSQHGSCPLLRRCWLGGHLSGVGTLRGFRGGGWRIQSVGSDGQSPLPRG